MAAALALRESTTSTSGRAERCDFSRSLVLRLESPRPVARNRDRVELFLLRHEKDEPLAIVGDVVLMDIGGGSGAGET
jgi:hypothetical protein